MTPIHVAFVVPENKFYGPSRLAFEVARRLHAMEGFAVELVLPGAGPLDRAAELAKLPVRHAEYGGGDAAGGAAAAPAKAAAAGEPRGGGLLARLFGKKAAGGLAAPAASSSSAGGAAGVDALRLLFGERKYDAVIASRATFGAAGEAAKASGIPYFFHLQESAEEARDPAVAGALERQQATATAVWHVPGSAIDRFGAATTDAGAAGPGRPLAVPVNNAVDLEHFGRYDRKGCREDLNAEFSADKDGPIVLFVGELSHQKGVDLLWEAAYDLFFRWPKMHIVLIGPDGPDAAFAADLRAKIEASDFEDRFYLAGPKGDVAPYMTGATVFCLPTRADAQPMVLLEAMAAGLPIVTTDVGAIPALLREGEIAFLHPADDPQPIQEGIEKILSVEDVRRRYAEGGAARAKDFPFEPLVGAVADTVRKFATGG